MTLQATLNCSICNGSLINTAQIFNPQDWAQATAPFSPILSPAQIVLDKKQSISGQAFTDNTVTVVSGQTITYQVTVSNIGGQAQTNLFINDIMPVGVDYVSSTINVPGYPGVTVSANTIGVQDVLNTSTFTLQPGQTATLTVVGYVSELHNVYTNIAKAIIFPSTVVAQDSVNAI